MTGKWQFTLRTLLLFMATTAAWLALGRSIEWRLMPVLAAGWLLAVAFLLRPVRGKYGDLVCLAMIGILAWLSGTHGWMYGGKPGVVVEMQVSRDGGQILVAARAFRRPWVEPSGSLDYRPPTCQEVVLLDSATGRRALHLDGESAPADPNAFPCCVGITGDGRTAVAQTILGRIKTWDVRSGVQGHEVDEVWTRLKFAMVGRRQVALEASVGVAIREIGGAEPARLLGDEWCVRNFSVSGDGNTLALPTRDGIGVWDIASGRKIASVPTGTGWSFPVLNANGTKLSFYTYQGYPYELMLWDSRSNRITKLGPLEGCMCLSPKGNLLATAWDQIGLWDVSTSNPRVRHVIPFPAEGRSLAFSPDEKTLYAGGADGTVTAFDTATMQVKWTSTVYVDRFRWRWLPLAALAGWAIVALAMTAWSWIAWGRTVWRKRKESGVQFGSRRGTDPA